MLHAATGSHFEFFPRFSHNFLTTKYKDKKLVKMFGVRNVFASNNQIFFCFNYSNKDVSAKDIVSGIISAANCKMLRAATGSHFEFPAVFKPHAFSQKISFAFTNFYIILFR